MYELSPEQVKYITKTINRQNITFSHLREDIIDHVCCIIEARMGEGKSFHDTLSQVLESIGIDGFKKIQEQTILYINQTYQIMKNLMKISGIISTILVTFGALFKIEHWPGGGILVSLGYLVLLTTFLPSLMYVLYSENKAGSNRFVYISGFMGFFVFFLSLLFKIQHWPGAGILMGLGILLICLFFLPALLNKFIRESEDRIYIPIIYLGIACLFVYFFAFYFKIMHWPGASILTILSLGLFALVLLPWYGIVKMKRSQMFEGSFIFITLALSWFVLTGALINYNVSIDIRPQYSKAGHSYEAINNYLKTKVDKQYKEIVNTGMSRDTNLITRITHIHDDANSLVENLEKKENELLLQWTGIPENLKGSKDKKVKFEFVYDFGIERIGDMPVSSTFQTFDSLTKVQFRHYFEATSTVFPENKLLIEELKLYLEHGLGITDKNEKSENFFTENGTVTRTLNSLNYLQNAVYDAEELVFIQFEKNQMASELKNSEVKK
jgi:hypothetical protein